MKNRHLARFAATALVLMVSLTACGSVEGGSSSGKTEASPEEIATSYSVYAEVLTANETAIRDYKWQYECDRYGDRVDRQTSLCDINGDGMEELFFMSVKNNAYSAGLDIYTCVDGQAKEMSYAVNDRGSDVYGDKQFYDVAVGSGVQYVIYTVSDKDNGFILYYNDPGDETAGYRLHEYEVDANGQITEINVIELENRMDMDGTGGSENCWKNGETITKEQFETELQSAAERLETVILYSGSGETKVWYQFSAADPISKSYDDMITFLNNNK